MTSVKFLYNGSLLTGFDLRGHATADADDEAGRLVCSAVSSAAYMAANTITDVLNLKCDIFVDEAEMRLNVLQDAERCQPILLGFKLHMEGLLEQYSDNIRIILEEK